MEEALNFVCPSKDCNQRIFSDEKQLTSHKRKHDMVLTLSKTNQVSSDQTPTPTRFLRSCDAIGLFQDLQNVNPFDETFKKAAEAVKKGETIRIPNISTLGKAAGEDLHTPHIDLTDDTQSSNNGNDEEEDCEVVTRSEADTSLKHNLDLSQQISLCENSLEGKKAVQDVRLFFRMPDGTLLQIPTIAGNLGIVNIQNNVTPADLIIPTHNVPDESLKLQNIQPNHPENTTNAASIAVKQKLKAHLRTSKGSSEVHNSLSPLSATTGIASHEARKEKRVSSSTTIDEDDEKKKKSLERNRVAAMRCREKRKRYVAELRAKCERVCATNAALAKELAFYRNEVERLKKQLILQQFHDVSATTGQIIPPINTHQSVSNNSKDENDDSGGNRSMSGRIGRENLLRLDIEGARAATTMDLDSPLVRKDEILSSVALPSTPNERIISFPELERCGENEVCEEKMLTTVIQINPNVLTKLPSTFS